MPSPADVLAFRVPDPDRGNVIGSPPCGDTRTQCPVSRVCPPQLSPPTLNSFLSAQEEKRFVRFVLFFPPKTPLYPQTLWVSVDNALSLPLRCRSALALSLSLSLSLQRRWTSRSVARSFARLFVFGRPKAWAPQLKLPSFEVLLSLVLVFVPSQISVLCVRSGSLHRECNPNPN